jgi:hypothetical protein
VHRGGAEVGVDEVRPLRGLKEVTIPSSLIPLLPIYTIDIYKSIVYTWRWQMETLKNAVGTILFVAEMAALWWLLPIVLLIPTEILWMQK